MTRHDGDCSAVRQALVDYADGLLTEAEGGRVAAHLAACQSCRRELRALGESLELARGIWAEEAEQIALPELRDVRKARTRGGARWRWAAASAAAVVLVSLVAWSMWHGEPTAGPPDGSPSVGVDFRERIEREGAAAALAASARILSRQPGGEEAGREALAYVAGHFPDTAAGREAKQTAENPR